MNPTAFDTLLRGIERENVRLDGTTFITLSFRQEYDYDGLEESMELLEGFSDETSAIDYVEQLTTKTLKETLTEPYEWGNSTWRHDSPNDNMRFKAGQKNSFVECVYLRSFEATLDTGYNTKKFQFEVLRVTLPRVIDISLFMYCDAEEEWVRYLMSKGKD